MLTPEKEMTVFEAILSRRSVRRYKKKPVEMSMVDTLLEAAVRAPTAMHQEPWAFIIIQDKELLRHLSDQTKPILINEMDLLQNQSKSASYLLEFFKNPDFNIFYDAGTLIIICGNKSMPSCVADCWLAAENLMLAACAMGLGSCVIGSSITFFNMPEVRAQLKIDDKFLVVSPILVGYPDESFLPNLRNQPLILSKFTAVKVKHN